MAAAVAYPARLFQIQYSEDENAYRFQILNITGNHSYTISKNTKFDETTAAKLHDLIIRSKAFEPFDLKSHGCGECFFELSMLTREIREVEKYAQEHAKSELEKTLEACGEAYSSARDALGSAAESASQAYDDTVRPTAQAAYATVSSGLQRTASSAKDVYKTAADLLKAFQIRFI